MPTLSVEARVDLSGLRRWEAQKRREVAAVIEKYAHLIAREAKARAAVDTGFMREHIEADVSRVLTDLVGLVVSGASYSIFVEHGTSRMAAQPFMLPAFEMHARVFYDEVRAALR